MGIVKLCVDSGSAFGQYATSCENLYQQYNNLHCDDGSVITVERGHISQVLTSKEKSGDRIIFVGLASCMAIIQKFADGKCFFFARDSCISIFWER
jgi:hypothetical protein